MSPITLDPITPEEHECGPPEELVTPPTYTGDIPEAPPGTGIVLTRTTHTAYVCGKPSDDESAPTPTPPASSALLSLGNRVYQFTHFMRIPVEGTLWLLFGVIGTSAVPLVLSQKVALRGISIAVDEADLDNDYTLEIYARTTGDYAFIDALDLLKTKLSAYRINLVDEIDQGAGIALRMIRKNGIARKSTFHLLTVSLEMRDV